LHDNVISKGALVDDVAAELCYCNAAHTLRAGLIARPVCVVDPDLVRAHRRPDARRIVVMRQAECAANGSFNAHLAGELIAQTLDQTVIY
jgi:hypothetical protein